MTPSVLTATVIGLLLTSWAHPASLVQSDRMARAQSYLQQGKIEQARRLLLRVVEQHPEEQPAQAMLGQIAFSRREFQQAAAYFRKAPAVLARTPLLRVNYAEALLESHSPELAKQELAALPLASAEAHFEAGLLLARHGDFAAAEQHFSKAKAGYPKPSVILYNLALAQYSAGKLPECIATLEEAQRRRIRTSDILNLLGQSYAEAGRNAESRQVLKAAIQLYPSDERNYVSLARVLVEDDSGTEALALIERGLKQLPKSHPLRLQRGYLLLTLGRNREAEADYRRILETAPHSGSAKLGLAFALIQSQRQAEAIKLLEQLISLDPSSYFPRYLLGELYIRQGMEEAAMPHLLSAKSLQPAFAPTRSKLGKLYLKKGDVAVAIDELETAIRLDPADAAAYYQLSIAYRKAGKQHQAQQALAKVRHLNETERQLGTSRFLTRRIRGLEIGMALPSP